MDAERAETFLRTLAEARLRQALTVPAPRPRDYRGSPSSAGRSEEITPILVTPVGRAIAFSEDERDGTDLTALVVTPDSSSVLAGSWTCDPAGGVRDHLLIHGLTATDDQGATYDLAFNGGGSAQLAGGPYELHPTPSGLISPYRRPSPRRRPRRFVDSEVTGLGDTVAALEAAGALPAGSPVPGQLAALCEQLGVTGHGILATPQPDLPETWRSMLAQFAAALPELDGDTAGQWHVAVVSAWNESYLQMRVVPAIDPVTTALELVIDGQTGRIRAELPVT